jgi:hypothetical protein
LKLWTLYRIIEKLGQAAKPTTPELERIIHDPKEDRVLSKRVAEVIHYLAERK